MVDLNKANEIRDFLRDNGNKTVDEICAAVGLSHDEVVKILDECDASGSEVIHAGTGRGGGWLGA